jgi:dephospho-CoA kinase
VTEARENRPPVLGLVGGIASGKSTVAELLAAKGARIVDADKVGHKMLRTKPVKERLTAAFGESILDSAGAVDHARLAEVAFGSVQRVDELNNIVHPPILEEIRRTVDELSRLSDVPLVVLDAALLLETGLHDEMCDALLFVGADEAVRRARAAEDRGLGSEQFEKREAAQVPTDEKRRQANYAVTNTGTKEELKEQLDGLWSELCRPGRHAPRPGPTNGNHLNS